MLGFDEMDHRISVLGFSEAVSRQSMCEAAVRRTYLSTVTKKPTWVCRMPLRIVGGLVGPGRGQTPAAASQRRLGESAQR